MWGLADAGGWCAERETLELLGWSTGCAEHANRMPQTAAWSLWAVSPGVMRTKVVEAPLETLMLDPRPRVAAAAVLRRGWRELLQDVEMVARFMAGAQTRES